jgi:IclR family transcriptional regulator, acetate operon repressor
VASSRPSGAQSVERALALLRALEGVGGGGAGITELADATGLTVSTAHRLIRALRNEGFAVQDPVSGRYHLGPALVVLGQRAAGTLGFDRLRPLLAEVVDATGESANLGVLTAGEVLVVLDVPSPRPLRFDQSEGTRVPAHTSAMGKALLAFAADPAAAVRALPPLEPHTERTITSPDQLLGELARTRERGWSLNDGERDPGVRAVGVPLLRPDGSVSAAMALQGPAQRMGEERLPKLVAALQRTAARMSPLLVGPTS